MMKKFQTWTLAGFCLAFCFACGGTDEAPPPANKAPLGDLEVRWKLVSADGSVLSCADVDIDEVEVAIGGTPKKIACDLGSTRFEKLLAQRYPVVVHLKYGPVKLATGLGNADVVAGELTTVEINIEVERRNTDVGSIQLKWRIDDQPAGRRCGEVGAITFRVTAEVGSIDPNLAVDVACVDGEMLINNVKPGSYDLKVKLEAPDGSNIVSLLTGTFRVVPAGTAILALINFTTVLSGGGKIRALYTINSSVAADACELSNAVEVKMMVRSVDQQTQSTRLEGTKTASCAEGNLLQKSLRTSVYSVQLQLLDELGLTLSSTTVRDVQIQFGETSTISYDFRF
jgi:hypothetical protein